MLKMAVRIYEKAAKKATLQTERKRSELAQFQGTRKLFKRNLKSGAIRNFTSLKTSLDLTLLNAQIHKAC
jgi:hypothetical protein